MTNIVTKATELVYQMDNDQLNQLVEAVKLKRTHLARQAVRAFSVRDAVQFTSRDGRTYTGTVRKVNRKYIVVDTVRNGSYRVPATMLQMLEA
ncbi:MAG: hypothetical protein HOM38_08865 [Euryarchaeota archaeon]|jgi:tetrahydromethanopterin S-methyltransferase subunit F|nr:hypothetical protein [Euryarchaeota archaeon]